VCQYVMFLAIKSLLSQQVGSNSSSYDDCLANDPDWGFLIFLTQIQ
jgi:hypothetical protein